VVFIDDTYGHGTGPISGRFFQGPCVLPSQAMNLQYRHVCEVGCGDRSCTCPGVHQSLRARDWSALHLAPQCLAIIFDTLAVLGADAPHVLGFLVVAIVAVAAPAASIDGDRAPAHIAATRIAAADALPIVTSFASNKKPVSVCHRCLAISVERRLAVFPSVQGVLSQQFRRALVLPFPACGRAKQSDAGPISQPPRQSPCQPDPKPLHVILPLGALA
jgi:hypothetical protein